MPIKKQSYSPFNAKDIDHKHFTITQISKDESNPGDEFTLSFSDLDLSSYGFPNEAELGIDVKRGLKLDGEELGSVSNNRTPSKNYTFYDVSGHIYIRLTVTDPDNDHYIGHSTWKHPHSALSQNILRTEVLDLGDIPWIFEITDDLIESPTLKINEKIPPLKDKMRSDKFLQSTIIPQVVYEILMKMYDQKFIGVSDQSSWHSKWYTWALNCPVEMPDINENISYDTAYNWALECAQEFSKNQKYKNAFINGISADDE
tara:strand:- start:68 stop:844 length:777 start_codon:yes stop_codon:yes gene_type:complete